MSYPMKLLPCYKSYLWGGTKLTEVFDKFNNGQTIAESWELACHANGTNTIENGVFQGKSLIEVIHNLGWQSLGDVPHQKEELPILVKLIDADKDLSIQVHPSDDTAKGEEKGKAEMWYIIDCEPQSYLYCGFSKDITPEEFESSVSDGTICQVLNRVPVKKGDVFYIFPGTIHAICKGVLIAEVQQNSDTTFRVYDYNRKDEENKLRELHMQRSKEVLRFEGMVVGEPLFNNMVNFNEFSMKLLFSCPYFTTYLVDCKRECSLFCDQKSFHHILVLNGTGNLCWRNQAFPLQQGDSYFLAAMLGEYRLKGTLKILISKR